MDWIPFFAIAGGVLCATLGFACGYLARSLREQSAARVARPPAREPAHALSLPPQPKAQAQARGRGAFEGGDMTQAITAVRTVMPPNALLGSAPTIDGETLFSYLKHNAIIPARIGWQADDTNQLGAWPNVVEDFYTIAGDSPKIAAYFSGVDMDGLKRHFLRALVTVTSTGLTVKTAATLEEAHAELRITGEDFDTVIGVLVAVLRRYLKSDIVGLVVPQMHPMIAALRTRLVTA